MDAETHGHLGNLQEKTLTQLLEMLHKQEKLLSRRKLLDALPDNGRKVRHFVQTLRQLILQRQSPGTSVFKNCDSSISATGISPDQHSSRTGSLSEFATLHDSSSLEDNEPAATSSDSSVQSTGKCDDLLEQGTHAKEDDEEDGAAATLTDCLEGLVISELPVPNSTSGAEMVCHVPSGGRNLETVFPNSYAKVMQRSSESGNKRAPFKPNSSLKIFNIQQLPDEYKQKSRTNYSKPRSEVMESDIQEVVNQKATGLKGAVRLHEESAVFGPAYKFSGAKEIPVTDSIWLQRQQMEQLQKIQTFHAAERLAERLNFKTGGYESPTINMDYRKSTLADDVDVCGDSDDVTEEEDEA